MAISPASSSSTRSADRGTCVPQELYPGRGIDQDHGARLASRQVAVPAGTSKRAGLVDRRGFGGDRSSAKLIASRLVQGYSAATSAHARSSISTLVRAIHQSYTRRLMAPSTVLKVKRSDGREPGCWRAERARESMALSMTSSLRIQATRATFFGLPAASSLVVVPDDGLKRLSQRSHVQERLARPRRGFGGRPFAARS